jgi:alpha-mannosidase
MGKMIDSHGQKNVVFVFNVLNWERNGFVDIKISGDFNAISDMVNGKTTEGIVITQGNEKYLRVYVSGIPSVGYKLLKLVNTRKQAVNDVFTFSGDRVETPFYTVKLDKSGAILSLFDKKLKKEWANGKLNDLSGPDSDNGENIKVIGKDNRHIKLLCASGSPVKHKCLITFYADNARIDFENTIQQNFEGPLHWSFDFSVDQPEVWHEEVGAVIEAKLASAGGHYANKMARYDYLTLNHFVNVGNSRESITLSNGSCLFFKLGNSKTDFLDANSSAIHVLIGGQVNDNLGVIKQDGDTVFNQYFSLMPYGHAFNQAEAMCFSLEHQNPLKAAYVTEGGSLKARKYSFFANNDKKSILWTLKPGEEDGIVFRMWNMEPKFKATSISFGKQLEKAMYVSHVETNIADVPVAGNTLSVDLNRYQIKTYHVWFK